MPVQFSQVDSLDTADNVADSLTSKKNSELTALQINNIGIGLFGLSPISGTTGMLNTNIGFDRINQSLKIILHTVKGEVPMLPKLGSNLDKYLFDPLDDILDDALRFAITDAIGDLEKRIKILDITFIHDEKTKNKLKIVIEYILTNTNIVHTFEDTIYTSNGGVV